MKKPKSIYFISIWTFLLFSIQKNTIFLFLFGTSIPSNEMQIISVLILGLIVFLLIFGLIKLNKVAVYTLIAIFTLNNIGIFYNTLSNLSYVMTNKYAFAAISYVTFIFIVNSLSIYYLINQKFRLLIQKKYSEKNRVKKVLKERIDDQVIEEKSKSKIVIQKTNIQIGFGYSFTIFAGFILMGLLITPNILERMDLVSLIFAGVGTIVMFYFGRINLNTLQWKRLMKYLLFGLASLIFIEGLITIFNLLFVENRLPHYTTGRVLWLLAMCALFILVGMIVGDEISLDEQEISH